ncbi:hypothetical protein [Cysteiniphilum sp. JM-1]|uniref:hypothetical protein n=1 Tax=Cysteiniphilum sp. JM-1 TaxID=2610891 RepID=UPI0012480087|nr:hypothetical protein [Cysteiniphilum sp. JM-1]
MDYLYACLSEKNPESGSIYYYAYRHCSEDKTKVLYALDQLKYQWLKASELYSEPYPSLQKLQWWQQALTDLKERRDHPLLTVLYQSFEFDALQECLSSDLDYALQTIAEGRNYQDSLDLSESFLGIAKLKAHALQFNELEQIKTLNHIDELLRHILMIGKHFSRNIILDSTLTPQITKESFHQVMNELMQYIHTLKQNLNLTAAQIKQLKPLIALHKQQMLCVKKFTKKVDNPFVESIYVSSFALLFTSVSASKL